MINVTLYTKEDCPLCMEAKALLAALQPRYPHRLSEVDITADPAIYERYRYRIPVFDVAGREVAAPICSADLAAALRAAGGATQ